MVTKGPGACSDRRPGARWWESCWVFVLSSGQMASSSRTNLCVCPGRNTTKCRGIKRRWIIKKLCGSRVTCDSNGGWAGGGSGAGEWVVLTSSQNRSLFVSSQVLPLRSIPVRLSLRRQMWRPSQSPFQHRWVGWGWGWGCLQMPSFTKKTKPNVGGKQAGWRCGPKRSTQTGESGRSAGRPACFASFDVPSPRPYAQHLAAW